MYLHTMLILFVLLTFLMLAVILSDVSRYRIPNWLVLALLVLYPVLVVIAPVKPDWMGACVVTLITFAVGLFILLPFMGGGDVKLLTALALFVGKLAMVDFIVYVAVLGGIGTLLLLGARAMTPYLFMKAGKTAEAIPRVLTDKEPVPYGVAIALAFLYLLWSEKLPGLILGSLS